MALLHSGLHDSAVSKRHIRYAQRLVDAGYSFDLLTADDHGPAAEVLRAAEATGASGADTGTEATGASGTDFAFLPQDSGLIARSADGQIAAVLAVTAVSFDNGQALLIRALATAEEFRSQGIATVLAGMAPQVLSAAGLPTRCLLVAAVPEARATFAHRAGFRVLTPGSELPVDLGGIDTDVFGEIGDRCWCLKEVK